MKLLQKAEGGALSPDAVNDLHDATDFALMATKHAAQAIGKDNGFLVILQWHLWLNLANLKDADCKVLLNAPVTPSGLFGDAVESIIERFVEAFQQQTMRSRSSSCPAYRSGGRPRSLARSRMCRGKCGDPGRGDTASEEACSVTTACCQLPSHHSDSPERRSA